MEMALVNTVIKLLAEVPTRRALGPTLLEATYATAMYEQNKISFPYLMASSFCPPNYSKLASVML
jgi:hypothetical protein